MFTRYLNLLIKSSLFVFFKKFLELEEREPNVSAAIENGIESKQDVPVVKLNRITAYWDKVIYCPLHLSLFKVEQMLLVYWQKKSLCCPTF